MNADNKPTPTPSTSNTATFSDGLTNLEIEQLRAIYSKYPTRVMLRELAAILTQEAQKVLDANPMTPENELKRMIANLDIIAAGDIKKAAGIAATVNQQ